MYFAIYCTSLLTVNWNFGDIRDLLDYRCS